MADRCHPSGCSKCLKDEDPYVRKTAAVCVAKLYDINGEVSPVGLKPPASGASVA